MLISFALLLVSPALASDLACGNAIKSQDVQLTLQKCSTIKFNPGIEAVVRMVKTLPAPATYAEAFQAYVKVAESGNLQAKTDLYSLYTYGIGTTPDQNTGLVHLKQAADAGFPEAQVRLGEHHNVGSTPDYDLQKAFALYQKAADQGNFYAMSKLARGYNYGFIGEAANPEKAKQLWIKIAEGNDPIAIYEAAEAAWRGNFNGTSGIAVAAPFYEKSANLGYGEAADRLATRYLVEGQTAKALFWYEKAASLGNPSGIASVAYLISDSDAKVKKDLPRAFKLYQELALEGDRDSQFSLAEFYEKGKGTGKDLKQALFWYKKAADQGSEEAQDALKRLQ
ncbi:tetratricopeptide repeat protein [Deinococcus cellulosilyticus]|nr:SEL1-like repeat protein [Deinococcus cellulosilyticus]